MIAPKSQTTKFALRLAAIITVMAIFFPLLLFYGLEINSPLWFWLVFGFVFFLFSLWVIKYYTEHLIYRQIKKIYKDVQGLEDAMIDQSPVTLDLNVLTEEVERFTENRQLELTSLKIARRIGVNSWVM